MSTQLFIIRHTSSDNTENHTMAADLFATLFLVMIIAVGSTQDKPPINTPPGEKGKSSPSPVLYLFVNQSGRISQETVDGPILERSSVKKSLPKAILDIGAKELVIVFPSSFGPAEKMHELLNLINSALPISKSNEKPISMSWTLSNT